jgi:hypothetical protein
MYDTRLTKAIEAKQADLSFLKPYQYIAFIRSNGEIWYNIQLTKYIYTFRFDIHI